MKHLIFVGGTMGVGKTTVCQLLRHQLTPSVFLDGDWCWMLEPFAVTEHRKKMVTENIIFLLRQFLHDPDTEYIILCWVMHEQAIIDSLRAGVADLPHCFHSFSLVCSEEGLRKRLEGDIAAGIRQPDVIDRTLTRVALYPKLDTILIDADRPPQEVAADIAGRL